MSLLLLNPFFASFLVFFLAVSTSGAISSGSPVSFSGLFSGSRRVLYYTVGVDIVTMFVDLEDSEVEAEKVGLVHKKDYTDLEVSLQ